MNWTETLSLFFALLTVGANAFVLGAIALAIAARFSARAAGRVAELRTWLAPAALTLAWVVVAVATTGSLFYSEGAGFIPCKLCWYQRIAMYPNVLILGVAAWKKDVLVRRYVVPLVLAGAAISVYHYQLERFPSQGSPACTADASCTVTWVWQFHYISIPFMALSAFLAIATLLRLAGGAGTRAPVDEPEREAAPVREVVHQ